MGEELRGWGLGAGFAVAEHGLRYGGLSYGYREGSADPPLRPEVVAAGDTVVHERTDPEPAARWRDPTVGAVRLPRKG